MLVKRTRDVPISMAKWTELIEPFLNASAYRAMLHLNERFKRLRERENTKTHVEALGEGKRAEARFI